MTRLRKGMAVVAAAAVVSAVGVGATRAVSAATTESPSTKTSIVDKLATKFGLNKDDVQKVFDEEHATHEAEHQAKVSENLQKLVDNGTITADQKAKIETKLKDMQTKREADKDSFKNLTHEERKAKMDANKAELKQWAKDNGIDLTKLDGVLMGGPGGRHGGPGQMDM